MDMDEFIKGYGFYVEQEEEEKVAAASPTLLCGARNSWRQKKVWNPLADF